MEVPNTVEDVMAKMKEKKSGSDEADVSLASEVVKGSNTGGRTMVEDHVLTVLKMIQENMMHERETNIAVVKGLCDQIRALTEVVADHGRAIHALIKHLHIRADATEVVNLEPERKLRPEEKTPSSVKTAVPVESNNDEGSRGPISGRTRSKKGPKSSKGKSKKRNQKKASTAQDSSPTLKRKLTFEKFERVSTPAVNVIQAGQGSPFTYHTNPVNHVAEDMPHCMDLIFRPPAGMRFVGSELAVAAYIFNRHLSQSEVLVKNEHSKGERSVLQSLRPGVEVEDDVINLVAAMLTFRGDHQYWFLPTTFAQIALSPINHNINTFEFIRTNFMGYADELMRVYVPLYRNRHWYLMLIDLCYGKLVYLDSAKSDTDHDARISQMRYAAFFIENMLDDARFWKNPDHLKPRPSSYRIEEPNTGQQRPLSNDCGVWVCQWMMQAWVYRDFILEDVNDQTRMRLAIDLVRGRHNPIARAIGRNALAEWDRSALEAAGGYDDPGEGASGDDTPSASLTI